MLDYRNRRLRQGSAMLLMVFLVVFLAGTLLYVLEVGVDASNIGLLRETKDSSLATAELSTELAVANLGDMEIVKLANAGGTIPEEGMAVNLTVLQDWVNTNLFAGTTDQRRIGGTIEGVDYRVRVRSLRDARENETMPQSWLKGIELGSYNYGVDPLRKYSNAYEITASARNSLAILPSGGENPRYGAVSTLKSLVSMSYNHLLNNQEDMAVLNIDNPSVFASVNWPTHRDGATYSGPSPSPRLMVSGEDHYATKTVIDEAKGETTIIVVEEIQSMKGTPSQMFSVINTPWNYGQLTLQYQRGEDFNPFIPRTNRFYNDSTDGRYNILHRQMIALNNDSSVLRDKYVFGGKSGEGYTTGNTGHANYFRKLTDSGSYLTYGFGRSITLLEDDLIEETTVMQATPQRTAEGWYDVRAFVIGSFDSLLKLYLNFTQANHPTVSANAAAVDTWKDKWKQVPLAYWSKLSVRIGQSVNQIPLYNYTAGATRHPSTLFWVKNADGQFLVRDYKYTSSSTPPDRGWTGYYTWADYYGYTDSDSAGAGKYHKGWFSYSGSQNSSNAKTLHTRFFTLEELLGKRVTKGPDGLPAKLQNGQTGAVVSGVPELLLDGDGKPIVYDPYPASLYENHFDEVTQRADHNANYGVKNNNAGINSVPLDGIYVIDRDRYGNIITERNEHNVLVPKTKICRTMADFAYDRDVKENASDPADIRSMVTLQMVIEISPETHPSGTNMWWDMGLSLTVVAPKVVETEKPGGTQDASIIGARDLAWWEVPREETLTDRLSHYALMANVSSDIMDIADHEERLKKIYEALGFDKDDSESVRNIFTAIDDVDETLVKFPRAMFDRSKSEPVLLNPGVGDSYSNGGSTVNNVYYCGKDDARRFFNYFYPEKEDTEGMLDDEGNLVVDPIALVTEKLEQKLDIKLISIYDLYVGQFGEARSKYRKNGPHEESPSAIRANGMYTPGRSIAKQVFGAENQEVPAVYMFRNSDGTLRHALNKDLYGPDAADPGQRPDPMSFLAGLDFLPSEIKAPLPERGMNEEYPALDNNTKDHLPILNKKINTTQGRGRAIEPRILYYDEDEGDLYYKTAMRTPPTWLSEDKNDIIQTYGAREYEGRFGIGWHRDGPNSHQEYMKDYYEYVILGKKGYIPYERDGSDGYIAMVCTRDDYDGSQLLDPASDFKPVLKNPDGVYNNDENEKMPTFVIEGESLDGAGIMVVNGNLLIKTVFAYHGTLVVLGNIYIDPGKALREVRNDDGMVIDNDGRALKKDENGYYYIDNTDTVVRSNPKMEEQWKGKLVVQGQVYVGGKITAREGGGAEHPLPGMIDIRGSTQAVEETTWTLLGGKETKEIHRLNWTSGDSLNPEDNLWLDQ